LSAEALAKVEPLGRAKKQSILITNKNGLPRRAHDLFFANATKINHSTPRNDIAPYGV
jgi:hypothetical protein